MIRRLPRTIAPFSVAPGETIPVRVWDTALSLVELARDGLAAAMLTAAGRVTTRTVVTATADGFGGYVAGRLVVIADDRGHAARAIAKAARPRDLAAAFDAQRHADRRAGLSR